MVGFDFLQIFLNFLRHFLSPGVSSGGSNRTLDLGMMGRVFYHCAAGADHHQK
jgi:hypothetical protein